MKKLTGIVIVSVLLALECTSIGLAAESNGGPDVRVNGCIVEFPDVQPYINADGRTMIPVRGVGEALGADVSYDSKLRAAVIEKDGTKLTLPVGSNQLTVEKNGESSVVIMDTETVLQDGIRTMVPIRPVAEALGAWVSFSTSYNTVQIYDDVLTPEEIDELHALDNHWKVCEERKVLLDGKANYENLNECCIREFTSDIDYVIKNIYNGDTYINGVDKVEDEVQLLADYICSSLTEQYTYGGAKATFRTDVSCLAATTNSTNSTYINRGYLTIEFDDDADIAKYKKSFNTAKFGDIKAGETYTYAIESIWMINIASGRPACMGKYDLTGNGYEPWR